MTQDYSQFTTPVEGTAAHDTIADGAPVRTGGKAVALKATPTAVAAGDVVDKIASRGGIEFGIGGHPNTERLVGKYNSAQSATSLKALSAGESFVVTSITMALDYDAANIITVELKLGSNTIGGHPGLQPGSGLVDGAGSGVLAIGASGEDLTVDCDNPGGGGYLWVFVTGYKESI